jgi:hypothetical protein
VRRIGQWEFQPDSHSWKLSGLDYWLRACPTLSDRDKHTWCFQCSYQYVLKVAEDPRWLSPGHRFLHRRYRLYTIPPRWYCQHTVNGHTFGALWGDEMTVCDQLTWWFGWSRKAPRPYSHEQRYPPPATGRCLHVPALRRAMARAEGIRTERENKLAEQVMRSLSALGGPSGPEITA